MDSVVARLFMHRDGNGLFQPSSSTFLTYIARDEGYDLGMVMGAQESLSAFARILGPLSGGLVWEMTASGSYPWDYHTVFHLCGFVSVAISRPSPFAYHHQSPFHKKRNNTVGDALICGMGTRSTMENAAPAWTGHQFRNRLTVLSHAAS